MLKLYYSRISLNSRGRARWHFGKSRWRLSRSHLISTATNLSQIFWQLTRFHRIPVLVDEDLTVVESLAILDDREAKYPTPALSISAETYL